MDADDHADSGGEGGAVMATNQAAHGTIPDSPHVLAFTNVDRGMTPAVWDAVDQPTVTGVWEDVAEGSGPADRSGNVTGGFESSGRWRQT